MRRICIFMAILIAALAVQVSARQSFVKMAMRSSSTEVEFTRSGMVRINVKDPQLRKQLRTQAASRAVEEITDWQSIGEGKFEDGWVTASMVDPSHYAFEVEFEESASVKGMYRMKSPYTSDRFLFLGYNENETETDIVIDGADPELVIIPIQYSGYTDSDIGDVWVGSIEAYYIDFFEFTKEEDKEYFSGNVFVNGVLTIDDPLTGTSADDFGYSWETVYPTVITLPGSKDYSISIMSPTCEAEGSLWFKFTTGNDVTKVKYMVAEGAMTASNDLFDFVAEEGTELAVPVAKPLVLDMGSDETAINSFIAVTLDDEGKYAQGVVRRFYTIADEPDKWRSLGNAVYKEGVLSGVYSDLYSMEYDVEIQESVSTPGLFRLVNPYDDKSGFCQEYNHLINHEEHNHYITVDATDADKVFVHESPLGIDCGDGDEIISSVPFANSQNDEETDSDYYGTMADGVITLPAGMLLLREPDSERWGYANSEAVTIKLPSSVGVTDIITDNTCEPKVYYNLQGMKISNPASGHVYIVRQGTNTTKEIVK